MPSQPVPAGIGEHSGRRPGLAEAVEHEVGAGQVVAGRVAVHDHDAGQAGGLRRLQALGRVLDHDHAAGLLVQLLDRGGEDLGIGLAVGDVVAGHDDVPLHVGQGVAQQPLDPAPAPGGAHRPGHAGAGQLPHQPAHARAQLDTAAVDHLLEELGLALVEGRRQISRFRLRHALAQEIALDAARPPVVWSSSP